MAQTFLTPKVLFTEKGNKECDRLFLREQFCKLSNLPELWFLWLQNVNMLPVFWEIFKDYQDKKCGPE